MNEQRINKTNIGLSLLKALMAFEVVLSHFCKWNDSGFKYILPFRLLNPMAVPIFFIISFYFAETLIVSHNKEKQYKRLSKLFIPQFTWAIIYFVVFYILQITFIENTGVTPVDLLYQILTGHSSKLNSAMWFQFDLIVITALFCLIFNKLSEKKGLITILIVSFVCLALTISGINYSVFENLIFEFKYPLGRIAETIPYATIGFTLRYFNILEKLKKYRYPAIIIATALFVLGFSLDWVLYTDFGYGNISQMYISFFPVIIAYLMPFEYLPLYIKKCLLLISKHTLGIYCCHILVAKLLELFVPQIYSRTFIGSIIIYTVSYLMCSILEKLPIRNINSIC